MHGASRSFVVAAIGFLVGVTAAYVFAPGYVLACLVVGAAIASATVFGLSADALLVKQTKSEVKENQREEMGRKSRDLQQTVIDRPWAANAPVAVRRTCGAPDDKRVRAKVYATPAPHQSHQ